MKKHVAGRLRSIAIIILAVSFLSGLAVMAAAESGPSGAEAVIDINSASVDVLAGLPGIGKKKAGEIVKWRHGNGGFNNVEDLMNVKGIGLKTFEKIRPLISVKKD